MNLKVIKQISISGTVTPPSSKSQTIRGLVLATLAKGKSVLRNALESEDTKSAVDICTGLGVKIERVGNDLIIESQGIPLKNNILKLNTGNSGITTRFILPALGLRASNDNKIILDCGMQMKNRPLDSLTNALADLGLNIKFLENKNKCPLEISGELLGGKTEVDGTTSQYLSALLLNLPCAKKDSEITVENLNERPYVEMTLEWLDEQGIKYEHNQEENKDIYKIYGGQEYKNFEKQIPADFSSASYLITAGVLLPGQVSIEGVDMEDLQGDKRLVYILKEMGADIKISRYNLEINGGKELKGIKIDANDIPDMVPTLAVIGTYAKGKTEIINVRQARIKETDRIHSMTEGLSKMGAQVEEREDGLTIHCGKLVGTSVYGYEDHRTVMALALAGMIAEGETEIEGAEAMNKTFPEFIKKMNELNIKI